MPNDKITQLTQNFMACANILTAFGDETRQHLIIEMMKLDSDKGARVGEITARTYLSRPAVSHHLQILKEAGIVKVRKEGTKNYYYFNPDTEALNKIIETIELAKEIVSDEEKNEFTLSRSPQSALFSLFALPYKIKEKGERI